MDDNKKIEIYEGIAAKVSSRLVAAAKELMKEEIGQINGMISNVSYGDAIGLAKLVETKAKIKAMAFREVANLQKDE